MPMKLQIDREKGYVLLTVGGASTRTQSLAMIMELDALFKSDRKLGLLVDAIESEILESASLWRETAGSLLSVLPENTRIAYAGPSHLPAERREFARILAAELGHELTFHTQLEDARAWISQTSEPAWA